jgi:phosphocarrier protein HPr
MAVRSIEIMVTGADGLHARPAAVFVRVASSLESSIQLENLSLARPSADARSLISVLSAGVERGHTVRLIADGPDEDYAVAALAGLLSEPGPRP